jgi:hypothetical protein
MIVDAILRPLKRLLRRGLSQAGFQVVRTSTLPFGYDVLKRSALQSSKPDGLHLQGGCGLIDGEASFTTRHRQGRSSRADNFYI